MRERESEREREICFNWFSNKEILANQDFMNPNGQFMCNEREREQSAPIGFQTREFLPIKIS